MHHWWAEPYRHEYRDVLEARVDWCTRPPKGKGPQFWKCSVKLDKLNKLNGGYMSTHMEIPLNWEVLT